MAEESGATGWYIPILVILIGGIAAALLPFSVALPQRIAEAGSISGVVLLYLWVLTGGLQRRASRRAAISDRLKISKHPDVPGDFWELAHRAFELFATSRSLNYSFETVSSSIEGRLNGTRPGVAAQTQDELRAANSAISIRMGWDKGSQGRAEMSNEIGRLLLGPGKRDTDEFRAATRLLEGYLQSAFSTVQSYIYELRRANPLRFNPESNDEWERFREKANALANDARQMATRYGIELGLSGSWGFQSVPTLVVPGA